MSPEARGRVTALVRALTVTPYVLPLEPPSRTSVALVLGAVREGAVIAPRIVTIGPEGLGPDRAFAEAIGAPPDGWIVVLDPDGGAVRYWAPVRLSRSVRYERPSEPDGTWRIVSSTRPSPTFAVHVPEVAGAAVFYVHGSSARSGAAVEAQFVGRCGGRP
jgi:hypothetical protein